MDPRAAQGPSTVAVHAGTRRDAATGAVGTPIYQTSTFLLNEDTCRAMVAGGVREHLIYSRYGNPSQWAVQEKLAALEGAESAVVFSSGMAAIAAALLGALEPGGRVVAARELYGGTYRLLSQELPALGHPVDFVDLGDPAAVEAVLRPDTQVLYAETLTNPLLNLADVEALSALAKRHGLLLVVDGTFTTPLGLKALDLGADLVVHSASKYLNGHSDLIAGAAMGSKRLVDRVWSRMLSLGGSLDPHACFLLERGLKTLAIRLKAHEENGLAVARFLESRPEVARVLHPGLPSHPQHELARRTLAWTGGMVTFDLKGGDAAAEAFARRLKVIAYATSLGGVESLVSLPFNTSHAAFTPQQREAMGLHPGCVRLSVGIENPEDLVRDVARALETV
jgi:cystathionine beta-lyase/cystathionine gamma-synthase